MGDPDGLPWPAGWSRREQRSRLGGAAGVALFAVVALVFVVVALLHLDGVTPQDLLRPPVLLRSLVDLLRAGPVPWLGAIGLLVLVATPAVTLGAFRRERERLVRTAEGEWALRFGVAHARQWRTALFSLGALCLLLAWSSATSAGSPGFLTVVAVLFVVATVVPLVVRTVVQLVAPERRSRVELTQSRFVWHTVGGRVSVAWPDVGEVVPVARTSRGEGGGAREFVGVRPRPGALVEDGRRWRRGASSSGRFPLLVPTDTLAVSPERLYWAAVAFVDRDRREALLSGAEVTAATR